MNAERLTYLADFLAKHADQLRAANQFDLHDWTLHDVREPVPGGDCGFVACACGWAGKLPLFKEQGFTSSNDEIWFWPKNGMPRTTGWAAVREFFGLGQEAADHLFSYDQYPCEDWYNPAAVAARIHAFVADGGVVMPVPATAEVR